MLLYLVKVVLEGILKDGIGYIFYPLRSLLDNVEAVLGVGIDVDRSIHLLQRIQVLAYNIKVVFIVLVETHWVGDILQSLKIFYEL